MSSWNVCWRPDIPQAGHIVFDHINANAVPKAREGAPRNEVSHTLHGLIADFTRIIM
jgi:hypothetical protein